MEYIIGIDGGGTKTKLLMTDRTGGLILSNAGGPSNINAAGYDGVRHVLLELVQEALTKAGATPSECLSLCMGAAGAGRAAEREAITGIFREMGFGCGLVITDDVMISLYGGLDSNIGVMVISGTGSICLGRNKEGKISRSGGWGHILGDEGSGYDIGRRILTSIMRSYDGRGPKSAMSPMVLRYLGLEGPEDLVEYVYRSGKSKKDIAALAAFADEGCAVNDAAALSIIEHAAGELHLAAVTVIGSLGLTGALEICMGGGTLTGSRYLSGSLIKRFGISHPAAHVIPMRKEAAWGAVRMAMENANLS